MSDPRICVVGAGSLSSRRIYPYLAAAGAQLVGVCDLDRGKAETNARRFGGTPYADMEAMLDAEAPDGVILCIGPAAHAALAPRVMRRGTPVYTEKPPAVTAAGALEVARISAETGVLCTTAFKKRYNTAYSRAAEWLGGFDEADRESISIDYASAAYRDAEGPGSFLLDFAIHAIDLVRYLFGEGTMDLSDGRSFGVATEEVEITVAGGNFMTVHNSSCWRVTEAGRCVEWREPPTFTSAGDSGLDTGHLAEIVDFLAAIRQGRSTRSCIGESYRSMVLYEAIRHAAETGAVVKPKYEALS